MQHGRNYHESGETKNKTPYKGKCNIYLYKNIGIVLHKNIVLLIIIAWDLISNLNNNSNNNNNNALLNNNSNSNNSNNANVQIKANAKVIVKLNKIV